MGGPVVEVGRGLGDAGTGGRAGTTGAVGVAGSKSIGTSSRNSRRSTAMAAGPEESRGDGGAGEGDGEAKGPSKPTSLQKAERALRHSLMAWLR